MTRIPSSLNSLVDSSKRMLFFFQYRMNTVIPILRLATAASVGERIQTKYAFHWLIVHIPSDISLPSWMKLSLHSLSNLHHYEYKEIPDVDIQYGKIHYLLLEFVLNLGEQTKRPILLETMCISANLSSCLHHRAELTQTEYHNFEKPITTRHYNLEIKQHHARLSK